MVKAIPIPENMKNLILALIKCWTINLKLRNVLDAKSIPVQRGLYHGDCLRPFLFVLITAGIIKQVKRDPTVARLSKANISVIAYMDDIKCHTNTKAALDRVTKIIRDGAAELGLELNVAKSAIHVERDDENTAIEGEIPHIQEAYKYLGIHQTSRDTKKNYSKIQEKIVLKAKQIFSSGLTSNQKMRAFNSTVIPMAVYVVGNLSAEESVATTLLNCKKLDQEVRQIAVQYLIKSNTTSNERLYLPPSLGGLGFKSIKIETMAQYIRRYHYLISSEELMEEKKKLLQLDKAQRRTPIGDYKHVAKQFHLHDPDLDQTPPPALKDELKKFHKAVLEKRKEKWAAHMYYPKLVLKHQDVIDFPAHRSPFTDSQKLALANAAAEEQIYNLRANGANGGFCRRGCGAPETAYHVLSNCKGHSFTPRHDMVVYWLMKTIMPVTRTPKKA